MSDMFDDFRSRYIADQEARAKRQELWDKRHWFILKSIMYIILTGWTFIILAALKRLFS